MGPKHKAHIGKFVETAGTNDASKQSVRESVNDAPKCSAVERTSTNRCTSVTFQFGLAVLLMLQLHCVVSAFLLVANRQVLSRKHPR